ncbi:MAG: hypothetical protein GC161_15815 [Planctomycetaceae bacterium]|nr:hypothetical protein [Planctomycetaceae bacterium]
MPAPARFLALFSAVGALSGLAAGDGKDEIEFFVRPAGTVASGASTLAISAASDEDLTVLAQLRAGGSLHVSAADGRADGLDPALGGFGPPVLLSSTAVALDEEGARVAATRGIVAWLDDVAGSSATRVHLARRDPVSGVWSAGTPVLALPAGDVTDYEVVLARAPAPILYVVAAVSGEVHVVQSLDGGASFGSSVLVSDPGATAFEVEAEGDFDGVALLFTDDRGTSGGRALWSRTGSGFGGGFGLGAETLVGATPGALVTSPELAKEGTRLLVGWLEGQGGQNTLYVRSSEDLGANYGPTAEPTATLPGIGAFDTVPSFDLEITGVVLQVAATARLGGSDTVLRYVFDGVSTFSPELLGPGFAPRFARQEGTGPNAPDSQTLVFSSQTNRGGVTLLGSSADQIQGSEYHDELVPFGADAGVDAASTVELFAVAYNRRYDNFVIPFATSGADQPPTLQVTGYRPITLIGENLEPGSTEAHLAMGHVPFEDTFVAALLSFSRAKGSLLLPDGRDTGLALDPLTFLGLSQPLFSTSFFAANDSGIEGAEFGELPFAFPGGLELYAVGVSFDANGAVRKVSDAVQLP